MSAKEKNTVDESLQNQFFNAMGDIAEPVYVLTTCNDQSEPTGFTATSVTSLSGNPPSLIFCVNLENDGAPAYDIGSKVAAHVLGPGQENVANRFAGVGGVSGIEKFEGDVRWHDEEGLPVLEGVHILMKGTVDKIADGYTHKITTMIVEEVHNYERGPLLYHNGDYLTV